MKDRFDDLPADPDRVGAHRAESPRISGKTLLFWSVIATVVLVAGGIVAFMLSTGRISLFPAESPSSGTAAQVAEGVIDTSYSVLLLNATGDDAVGESARADVIAAGWEESDVTLSPADEVGYDETTVFFGTEEDESAARGLAGVLGQVRVALDVSFQPEATEGADVAAVKQLVVVLGEDLSAGGSAS